MDGEGQKLDVIRKLLAKAERAATEQEAAAYNVKAAELMAKYGVDAALLAASGAKRDGIRERRLAMADPYSAEKAQLACWIGAALGCRGVRHVGYTGRTVDAVTLVGFESDLERAEVLYTSLLLQATRQVVTQRPSWSGESTTAFRRTWLVGFGTEVHRRLVAAEHRAVAEHESAAPSSGPSVALVLADRKTQVEASFAQRFPNLVRGRTRRLAGSGYSAGAAAGRRADLGRPRLAGQRPQLGR